MAVRERIFLAYGALSGASSSRIAYVIVVATLTILGIVPWWVSTLVPGHDYTQYLVFVRAVADYDDPSSPFFGTYTLASWRLMPTALPLHLTQLMWWLTGSLETAGKLLMSLYSLCLPLFSAWLLKVLGRNRWCVLLVFPLVYSVWSTSGFVAFTTVMPFVVLGTLYWMRWLGSPVWPNAAGVVVSSVAVFLWHGIGFVILACAIGILWLCCRPSSWRSQLTCLLPLLPSAVLFVLWSHFTLQSPTGRSALVWQEPFEAMATLPSWIAPVVPHQLGRAVALAGIVVFGLAAGVQTFEPPPVAVWRVRNPFLVLSAGMLVAYLLCPLQMANVEGVSNRFPIFAALFFVFAWPLPAQAQARTALLVVVGGFGLFSLGDMVARFRAFDRASIGASRLIDRLKPHQTLYGHMDRGGPTQEFPNKPLIGVSQYATARFGSLPNSSFAGYGVNYVKFVGDENPMPQLRVPASAIPAIKAFDYVLTRFGRPHLRKPNFQLLASDGDWALFRVCGSRAFPSCGARP